MTTFNYLLPKDDVSTAWEGRGADLSGCSLYWRQQQLLVLERVSSIPFDCPHWNQQPHLPPLSDLRWLTECLKRSPVRLVRIDAALGEPKLRAWAEACDRAGKALYLRLPSAAYLPQRRTSPRWWCKRVLDWVLAVLLLIGLSPLMFAIAGAISLSSPGAILVEQWRVGARGKLFKVLKFRTMRSGAEAVHHQVMANPSKNCLHKRDDDPRVTALGRWLRRYGLDELPQLINVIRGEMSLVGPRPWALYDAVRIQPEMQVRLNALPGIIGAWQVEARSTLLDLDLVNRRDLDYLRNWSLARDFRILLRTVPRVLSGFGAY